MWATALILGFAGSLHCIGMCAPLAIAVTSLNKSAALNRIIYNLGRVATYGMLGAAIASMGMILPIHRYQNIVSLVLGTALLLIGLGGIKQIRIPVLTRTSQRLTTGIKSMFGKQLTRNTRGAVFAMGSLNGLLPCGLSLLALTWCVTLRGPLDGFYFMLLFGVGTLPAMLGLTGVLPLLAKKLRWNIQTLTTSMLVVSGCILIARVFLVHVPHGDHASLVDVILCQ